MIRTIMEDRQLAFKICNLHICSFESFRVPRGQSLLTILAFVQEELPRVMRGGNGSRGPPLVDNRTTLLMLWPKGFILKKIPPFSFWV
jgi:hypothetical protein